MTEPSIVITPSRVSFLLALATVFGLTWSTFTYVSSQDHRLAVVENRVVDQSESIDTLVAEMKALGIAVARLTVVIERTAQQTNATIPISVQPRGVVETLGGLIADRAIPSTRDEPNLLISEDLE